MVRCPGEAEPLAGAEVVAVDLVRRGRVAFDDERAHTRGDVEMLAPFQRPMGERRGSDRAERAQVELLEGHGGERVLEGEFRNEFERPVAEEGVGVRVHDDREVAACAFLPVGVDETQRRVGAIDPPDPGVDGCVHEQWMAGPPFPGTPAFDLFDHGGIEADTAVEEEVAPLDRAETDAADVAGIERFEEHVDGVDAVVREAEDSGEDVGGAPREGGESGICAGKSVGCLVERAIAAEHDDEVVALPCGGLGETGGVAPPAGLGEGDVVVGGQRLVDHDPSSGGDRRGHGVHDEQNPHRR